MSVELLDANDFYDMDAALLHPDRNNLVVDLDNYYWTADDHEDRVTFKGDYIDGIEFEHLSGGAIKLTRREIADV